MVSEEVSCAEAFEPALAHALYCFDSEQEASRRLTNHSGFAFSALFGFLGLVLLRLNDVVTALSGREYLWALFFLGVSLSVWAALLLFGILGKKSKQLPVGEVLRYTQEEIEVANIVGKSLQEAGCPRTGQDSRKMAVSLLVYNKLLNAAANLALRNSGEKWRQDAARKLLLSSVCVVAMAVGLGSRLGPASEAEDVAVQQNRSTIRTVVIEGDRYDSHCKDSERSSPGREDPGRERTPNRESPVRTGRP